MTGLRKRLRNLRRACLASRWRNCRDQLAPTSFHGVKPDRAQSGKWELWDKNYNKMGEFGTEAEMQKHADDLARGRMYQVAIKAPPEHFLDWDKPLSEQSPKVQEAFGKIVDRNIAEEPGWAKLTGQEALNAAVQRAGSRGGGESALREAGIPGIKYLDQGSRPPSQTDLAKAKSLLAGAEMNGDLAWIAKQKANVAALEDRISRPPTRNYVVFDDKLIDIMKKYGIAGIGALPAMNAYHYQDKGS